MTLAEKSAKEIEFMVAAVPFLFDKYYTGKIKNTFNI